MPGSSQPVQVPASEKLIRKRRWHLGGAWLASFLFLVTLVTATTFGAALNQSFVQAHGLTLDSIEACYVQLWQLERSVLRGLQFSIPLLMILLAHELGHFLECRRRHIDASLPYFLPSPSLFGTFGAFIRIRSPIYTREGLFDVGIKGPLAGFAMLLPFFIWGVALSKVVPALPPHDSVLFGTPLLFRVAEYLVFPGVPASRILLHPIAVAAWAGLFATALNLLPVGQLDGGHIVYALGSEKAHRRVGLLFLLGLIVSGFFYWPWWLWGGAMFFFGRRHPLIYDAVPLSRSRKWLCVLAILIFTLSVTAVPVRSF